MKDLKKRHLFDLLETLATRLHVRRLDEEYADVDFKRFREEMIEATEPKTAASADELVLIANDVQTGHNFVVEPNVYSIRAGIRDLQTAITSRQVSIERDPSGETIMRPTNMPAIMHRPPPGGRFRVDDDGFSVGVEDHEMPGTEIVDPSTGEDLSRFSMMPSTPPPIATARAERFELDGSVKRLTLILGSVAGELGVGEWAQDGHELIARATLARNAASLLAWVKKELKETKDGVPAIQDPTVRVAALARLTALQQVQDFITKKFSLAGTLAWTDTAERDKLVNIATEALTDLWRRVEARPNGSASQQHEAQGAWCDVLRFLKAPIPKP